MSNKTIKIGGLDVTLAANVWTLIKFKQLFGKDWHSARNEQLSEAIKALNFQEKYAGIANFTDEEFGKLPQEKQAEYWQDLKALNVNNEFVLNTLYAMAAAGDFKGTMQGFFSMIPVKDLAEDSKIMQAVTELMAELMPEVKKKL